LGRAQSALAALQQEASGSQRCCIPRPTLILVRWNHSHSHGGGQGTDHRGSDLCTANNCRSTMSQAHARKAKPSP